jgi:hypothetical protein
MHYEYQTHFSQPLILHLLSWLIQSLAAFFATVKAISCQHYPNMSTLGCHLLHAGSYSGNALNKRIYAHTRLAIALHRPLL